MVNALPRPHTFSRLNPETTSTSKTQIITHALRVITHDSVTCTPSAEAGRAVVRPRTGGEEGGAKVVNRGEKAQALGVRMEL